MSPAFAQPMHRLTFLAVALALVAGAVPAARAQGAESDRFPRIPVWAIPGGWQDSTLLFPHRHVGTFQGPLPDSIREAPRTITVRFLRDRLAERRQDFGGYRIYRVHHTPDTSLMVLVRRFSVNTGDEITWTFSRPEPMGDSLPYVLRRGSTVRVVHDSIITFVDPDSNGAYYKVCRRVDRFDRCLSPGDSVFRLIAPPGPHDGFRTWYTVTYEAKNLIDNNFEDLFVPDTTGQLGPCPAGRATCPNLNHKALNLIASPVEPTSGPTPDLETVSVVPNPFRAREAWDLPGGSEVHIINLPPRATIQVYTVAGDLVKEIEHDDPVRDFARWDLRNQDGRDVASGIYMVRVTSGDHVYQNRFVVIR